MIHADAGKANASKVEGRDSSACGDLGFSAEISESAPKAYEVLT